MIAAGLPLGGKPGKALDDAYENLRIAVEARLSRHGATRPTMLDAIIDAGLTPTVPTDYQRWRPLHWVIEVPTSCERGGFDAIVGNPPFLGGKKITGAMGRTSVTGWSTFLRVGEGQRRPGGLLLPARHLAAVHDAATSG